MDVAMVVVRGEAWLPWLLIFPGVALLWASRTRTLGQAIVALGYLVAVAVGQLNVLAGLSIALLAAAGWAVVCGQALWIRAIGHLLFVGSAVALMLHVAPGFQNPLAIEGVVSKGAVPFKAYLNLDKTLVGIWIVCCVAWIDYGSPAWRKAGQGALLGAATFIVIAIPAVSAGVIHIDPKMPDIAWLWLLNNVVLVCFAEEAFFRGYIQHGLGRLLALRRFGAVTAMVTGALIFGLAHFAGGVPMMIMATVAGLGYGLAYRRCGLIGAIAAHATLNTAHFLLLTYPAPA
jgi:membrane protease YdiL (CAAX protease family)